MKNFTRYLFAVALFMLSFSAMAANFTIDTNSSAYRNHAHSQGSGISNDIASRQASMFSLIGYHNTVVSPGNKIKPGDTVTFKWQDGSSEKGFVDTLLSTVGISPIPGTQQAPSGGGGGGGGVAIGSGGFIGSGGAWLGSGGGNVTIIIGGIELP